MRNRKLWLAFLLSLIVGVALSPRLSAQESGAKGLLNGVVADSTGGAIAGAKVTVTGAQGSRNYTTNGAGGFVAQDLIPGPYTVRVEMNGFKTWQGSDVVINVGSVTAIRVVMEPGTVTETIEVVGSAVTVDTTTTAVATNLDDTFYKELPVRRGVASLFYLAPGVVSGGGTGASNPSIGGATGLENLYVADGVSITDTAFGGLGLYSRVYGSVGTGINLSFVKEVQVKTGAIQPQYGGATGGVVQIVTKSGGDHYHGAIAAYYQPNQFEATRVNVDSFGLFNKVGDVLHTSTVDVSGEIGGPVPGLGHKLFFFGAMDPSEVGSLRRAPSNTGNFGFGPVQGRTLTYNYAAKLTFKATDSNILEGSVFGDPTHTNSFPWVRLREGVLGIPNTTNYSKLEYGNRNAVVRYNGTFSPTWVLNASVAWQHNKFTESGYPQLSEIIDQTGAEFIPYGRGFVENTRDESYAYNLDTSKTVSFLGTHTFAVGAQYARLYYDGARAYSGPAIPAPIANADGAPLPGATGPFGWAGQTANYEWRLLRAPGSCTLCPFMNIGGTPRRVYLRMFRSEFGVSPDGFKHFVTSGRMHVGYAGDTWTINQHVTLDAGIRWQQERMVGEDTQFTFNDDWSPRIGVTVDPKGDRKNKIYFNFGRYSYNLPLDLAERSLTNEKDLFSFRLAPQFTTDVNNNRQVVLNQFGSVTPIIDSAHVVNLAKGGIPRAPFASGESLEAIHSGTRLTYEDEYIIGAEHQFSGGVVVSARYIHRALRRIVEDTGGISPEAALAGINQQFSITNPSANLDIFTNPVQIDYQAANGLPGQCGAGDFNLTPPITNSIGQQVFDAQGNDSVCFAEDANGNPLGANGAIAGSVTPDGIPDGFSDPIHKYWAVQFEVNKSFSHNWQLRANYQIAKLFGNFEGAFRNDNGQSDPGISSLFDFTPGNFGLLGDQFAPGPLNTDRLQVVNGYFSYVFDKGALKNLSLGTGVNIQTGTPLNQLVSHPVYENAGEVPLGGRGKEGRSPTTGSVDFHAGYLVNLTERVHLRFGADLFNIANTKRVLFLQQNFDTGFGTGKNPDFLKPANQAAIGDGIQAPFNARLSFRIEF